LLVGIDRGQSQLLDPRPQSASPLLSGNNPTPADGYFITANHKGGFKNTLWYGDWTALTDNEHCMPVADAIVCVQPAPAAPTCPQPSLSIVLNGANAQVSWNSSLGCSYQLRTNSAINGSWGKYGDPVAGDGGSKTIPVPVTGTELYFQLLLQ